MTMSVQQKDVRVWWREAGLIEKPSNNQDKFKIEFEKLWDRVF